MYSMNSDSAFINYYYGAKIIKIYYFYFVQIKTYLLDIYWENRPNLIKSHFSADL